MPRLRATFTGFIAVLLWSLLALLTVGSSPIPPLQLNAICFGIGGGIGLIWIAGSGGFTVLKHVPIRIYVFGTLGLFGYHALYFSALRMAPAAEAGLIAYLWPLLIVIFSGLLPGENLKMGHLVGALISFIGASLIISGGGTGFKAEAASGYAMAGLCALTWSGYSVLSRRLGAVPSQAVVIYCLASAVLSVPLHLFFETTVWPQGALGWASVLLLGLGPVGVAFFVWDIGVKHGDIQLLGTASYAAPLLSTMVLVGFGIAEFSPVLFFSAALIAGGALIAARASMKVKR